jgi:hypothetical protein
MSQEPADGVNARDCAYRRMWAELRGVLDVDLHSAPARSTPSARRTNHSRRYHAERLLIIMEQIEAEVGEVGS